MSAGQVQDVWVRCRWSSSSESDSSEEVRGGLGGLQDGTSLVPRGSGADRCPSVVGTSPRPGQAPPCCSTGFSLFLPTMSFSTSLTFFSLFSVYLSI